MAVIKLVSLYLKTILQSIKVGLYTLGVSLSENVTQDIELQANLGYF